MYARMLIFISTPAQLLGSRGPEPCLDRYQQKNHTRMLMSALTATQLLGLRGREQYLDRQVADAHEELRGLDLEDGYTPRVAAGRAACLDEARRALQASRGRPTRDAPAVQVSHDALPGALALLQQVRTPNFHALESIVEKLLWSSMPAKHLRRPARIQPADPVSDEIF
jgi:hypothetical protein